MAITDPEAVRFSNERARVFADALLQAIETADAFIAEWTANPMLATLIPNSGIEIVNDGAAIDGRHPATGAKINVLVTAATDLATWGNTGTPTRKDRLRAFAVNGQPRF